MAFQVRIGQEVNRCFVQRHARAEDVATLHLNPVNAVTFSGCDGMLTGQDADFIHWCGFVLRQQPALGKSAELQSIQIE